MEKWVCSSILPIVNRWMIAYFNVLCPTYRDLSKWPHHVKTKVNVKQTLWIRTTLGKISTICKEIKLKVEKLSLKLTNFLASFSELLNTAKFFHYLKKILIPLPSHRKKKKFGNNGLTHTSLIIDPSHSNQLCKHHEKIKSVLKKRSTFVMTRS